MRIIRVTGSGHLRLTPDETRLEITLEQIFPQYEQAVRRASEDAQTVKTLLESVGFSREQVKTASFNVDTRFDSVRDAQGNYRQVMKGYAYSHVLRVRFPCDNALLGRALYGLSGSPLSPRVDIYYTVSQPERAVNALLHAAVGDAMQKAQILADASGVTLREIESIDYSWGELELTSRVNPRMDMGADRPVMLADTYEMDVDPEEIELSDTVTVVWSIGRGDGTDNG